MKKSMVDVERLKVVTKKSKPSVFQPIIRRASVPRPRCVCGKIMKSIYVKQGQRMVSIGWICLPCGAVELELKT